MDLWLPGYEHQPEHGAGLGVTSGAPKVVIHTTESGPGSLQRIINSWHGPANWGKGLPHFIAEGDRYVQLLPLNVGAYTLENKGGGADTNRCGPAIQVEIVGYARDPFDDVEYEALGRWLADLVKAGVPLDLSQHPTFHGEGAGWILASYTARQRLTAQQYHDFAGFLGHQHCPENAHWDPGSLDAARVERIARAHLEPDTDPAKDEDDMPMTMILTTSRSNREWLEECAGWLDGVPPGHTGPPLEGGWSNPFAGLAAWEVQDTHPFIRRMTRSHQEWLMKVLAWQEGVGDKVTVIDHGLVSDDELERRTFIPSDALT